MSRPSIGGSADVRSASSRAITATCVGNAVEWYDFAIYGALATVLGVVYFPSDDVSAALFAAFAVYGTALLVRPLGAVVFGRLGDRRGRRGVLIRVVFLMTGATAAVALLPGYATIGLLAPIGLMVLRAVQGLAAGGELGVAGVFILENAAASERGRTGALHIATMALGIGSGMVVTAALCYLFGAPGPDSVWRRLAFLIALPLGWVGVYLRRRIPETEHFLAVRAAAAIVDRPVRLLWQQHRPALVRGFCLLAAGALAFNVFFIFMPNHLIAEHGAGLSPTLLGTGAVLGVAAAATIAWGRLSDRIGRRPVVIASTAALAVLAVPMSSLATRGSIPALLLAEIAVALVVAGVLSTAMVGELFATNLRSTGLALTAGLATALVGGTAPWIAQLLVEVFGAEIAPGLYVSLAAVAALFALRGWPETAFRELA